MYRNSFAPLRVGGRGLQVPTVTVGSSVGLLPPRSGLLPLFLLCVGTPGLLPCWVSRVNLTACGQRLIEECVDIVLGFGVPRTVSFDIRDGVVFSSFSSFHHCNLRSRRQCSWSQRHRACGSSFERSTTVWCEGLHGGRADAVGRRSPAIVSGSLCSSSRREAWY